MTPQFDEMDLKKHWHGAPLQQSRTEPFTTGVQMSHDDLYIMMPAVNVWSWFDAIQQSLVAGLQRLLALNERHIRNIRL